MLEVLKIKVAGHKQQTPNEKMAGRIHCVVVVVVVVVLCMLA